MKYINFNSKAKISFDLDKQKFNIEVIRNGDDFVKTLI